MILICSCIISIDLIESICQGSSSVDPPLTTLFLSGLDVMPPGRDSVSLVTLVFIFEIVKYNQLGVVGIIVTTLWYRGCVQKHILSITLYFHLKFILQWQVVSTWMGAFRFTNSINIAAIAVVKSSLYSL